MCVVTCYGLAQKGEHGLAVLQVWLPHREALPGGGPKRRDSPTPTPTSYALPEVVKEGSGRLLVAAVCCLDAGDHVSQHGLAGQAWIGAVCVRASAVLAVQIVGNRTGECCRGQPLFISSYLASAIRDLRPGGSLPDQHDRCLVTLLLRAYSGAGSGCGRLQEHRPELDLEDTVSCGSPPCLGNLGETADALGLWGRSLGQLGCGFYPPLLIALWWPTGDPGPSLSDLAEAPLLTTCRACSEAGLEPRGPVSEKATAAG
ncbi:hypothetical protein NDU88_002476 [Pleurodeles waltl]|uniref:Uncharacterized protein n=1 Tax=Pleurodeles waltl TaxID=8319 RepID=A0AAV7NDU1_PLEWA|nr:hypothetical protein NDU88_002476 [Pleurodeles waltl]